MRLFDEFESRNNEAARYSEPQFRYLNRTGRPEFERVRQALEDWFSHYPKANQEELRKRFRSDIDHDHQAVFFELFLHELLLKLDYQLTLHPPLPSGVLRVPDFLAESCKTPGDRFYIEATLATNESKKEAGAKARINAVYDALDKKVDSRNFFLWLTLEGSPNEPPPAKPLAAAINQHLSELNPDDLVRLYEASDMEALPLWHFELKGWKIDIRPIPKKPEARGKPGVRPIGMQSYGARWVDDRTPLRDAILDKANRYGTLDLPYIIAVNALEPVDQIDIMDALFGKEQCVVTFLEGQPIETKMTRVPDGAWIEHSGPRYTRVSGVLLASRLSPWNVPRADLRLYHNPWAQKPCISALNRLPQAIPQDGHMQFTDATAIGDILGLSSQWPE